MPNVIVGIGMAMAFCVGYALVSHVQERMHVIKVRNAQVQSTEGLPRTIRLNPNAKIDTDGFIDIRDFG